MLAGIIDKAMQSKNWGLLFNKKEDGTGNVAFVICIIETEYNDTILLILIQASILMVGVRNSMVVCS